MYVLKFLCLDGINKHRIYQKIFSALFAWAHRFIAFFVRSESQRWTKNMILEYVQKKSIISTDGSSSYNWIGTVIVTSFLSYFLISNQLSVGLNIFCLIELQRMDPTKMSTSITLSSIAQNSSQKTEFTPTQSKAAILTCVGLRC